MNQWYEEEEKRGIISFFKEIVWNVYVYRTLGAAFILIFFVSAFSSVTEGQGRLVVGKEEKVRQAVLQEAEIQEPQSEMEGKEEKIEKNIEETENITERVIEERKEQETGKIIEKQTKEKQPQKKKKTHKQIYPCAYPDITVEDYECLSRIVMAEAGNQGEKGMILVANVVINRMKKFQMTIPQVVFQAGQFMPTWDGAYESVVVTDAARIAAKKALNGVDYSNGAMYFCTKKAVNTFFRTKLTFLFQYKDHLFYQ